MSYANDDFWKQYQAYVEESWPRHARAVAMLQGGVVQRHRDVRTGTFDLGNILDLGCGKVMEGARFARFGASYVGVEADPAPPRSGRTVLKYDYRRDLAQIVDELDQLKFKPQTILSLFSIEPTGSPLDNAVLYERLLDTFPSAQRIISAGFYYRGMEREPSVEEAGGLRSWQSIGPLPRAMLAEHRLLIPAPSKLFGSEVIEVWRLIERS